MKKICTLLTLLVCAGSWIYAQNHISNPKTYRIDPRSARPTHYHTPSASRTVVCDTDVIIDYNAYNEVTATNAGLNFNGSWYSATPTILAQELTAFKDANHAFEYTYAETRFDSLTLASVSTLQTSFYDRAGSTVYLDSLGMFIGIFGDTVHANNVMLHDSLVFRVYSITGTTISANPVVTKVYSGYNGLSPFFTGANYLTYAQIPIHYQFSQGQSFAVMMDYRGKDTSSHCIFSYTYADSCGTITYQGQQYSSPAYPSDFIGQALWGDIGSTGTVTAENNGFAYNLTGIAPNCSYVYTQNWEFLPIVTVCQNISATPPTVTLPSSTSVCNPTPVTVTATVSGGQTPYTYAWSQTGSSLSCNNCAAPTATITQNSTYTVTVTDANSQTATASVTYTVSGNCSSSSCPLTSGPSICTPSGNLTQPGLSPTSDQLPPFVNGQVANTVIQFKNFNTIVFGGQTLTMQSLHLDSLNNLPTGLCWATNKSNNTFSNSENGCILVAGTPCSTPGEYKLKIIVTVNVGLTITTDAEAAGLKYFVRCVNQNETALAVDTSQTAPFVGYGPSAICSGSTLQVSINKTDENCNGQSIGTATAVPSGGSNYTYSWSTGATTASISNLAAGTYTVTVTSSGNTATASVNITQPTALTVNASATATSCASNTGTATATASGGTPSYVFSWSNAGSGSNLTGLAAGNYTVTVADSKGCTASASATVTSPASFTINVTTTAVACYGASTGGATVTVTGGTGNITYNWSNNGTTATISNLAAGTYNVTVTDGSGCSKLGSGTVTQPAAAFSVSATSTPSTCGASTGTATATVANNNGSPTYSWSNGGSTNAISSLTAGVYSVTATAGGCTATTSVAVNNSNGPSITPTHSDPTCFGSTNGSATVVVTGGTQPYTYTWSTGASGATLSGVGAGTYTIVVTDNGGCIATNIITLVQPNAISASPTVVNASCNGSSNGSVTLAVSGGTGPYSYNWSNGAGNLSNISGLVAGNYTVTITDSKSCTATSTNAVTQPTALTANVSTTPSTGSNGGATVTASGGTAPYNYSWNNSQTGATLTGLAPGIYNVTVSDANGCSSTASGTVVLTGINEVNNSISSISLFPNPANEMVNVVVELESAYNVQINITDLTGKVIYNSHQAASGKMTHEINVSTYAAGVYIMEINAGQQFERRRFMVTH